MQILTGSVGLLDLTTLAPEQVQLRDLTAIEWLVRFTGQSTRPWTVANHSWFVADICLRLMQVNQPTWSWALLHDAHEAYIGDTIRPLESELGVNAQLACWRAKIDTAIVQRAGIDRQQIDFEAVALADSIALAAEIVHLFPSTPAVRSLPAVQKHWPLILAVEPPPAKKNAWRDAVREFWPAPETAADEDRTPVGGV
jgi:hypothetical protein